MDVHEFVIEVTVSMGKILHSRYLLLACIYNLIISVANEDNVFVSGLKTADNLKQNPHVIHSFLNILYLNHTALKYKLKHLCSCLAEANRNVTFRLSLAAVDGLENDEN